MDKLGVLETVYRSGEFIVLDTETTGIGPDAEIVEIACIDQTGRVLINTRLKPKRPIPPGATLVHGIKDSDVENAPTWDQVRAQVQAALTGKRVVIYNMEYDTKILRSTDQAYQIKDQVWNNASYYCAMLAYAEFKGEWNDYRGNFKWHKLTAAVEQQGLTVKDAHGALGDCLMTLALMDKIFQSV